jgi:hypothetical protein
VNALTPIALDAQPALVADPSWGETPALAKLPGVSERARARAAEIRGRDFTDDQWLALFMGIVDRRALLIRIDTEGCGVYAQLPPGEAEPVLLLYSPATACIVTTLPAAWAHRSVVIRQPHVRDWTQRKARRR